MANEAIYKILKRIMTKTQSTILLGATNDHNNPYKKIALHNQGRFYSNFHKTGTFFGFTYIKNTNKDGKVNYITEPIAINRQRRICDEKSYPQGKDLFHLPDNYEYLLNLYINAKCTQALRTANCGGSSAYYAHELWAEISGGCEDNEKKHAIKVNPGIHRIEVVNLNEFDHTLVLINRKDPSDDNVADTWGDNCWVIDWWGNKTGNIPAISKCQKFDEQMARLIEHLPDRSKLTNIPENFTIKTIYDIRPNQLPYLEVGHYHPRPHTPLNDINVKHPESLDNTTFENDQQKFIQKIKTVHNEMMRTFTQSQEKNSEQHNEADMDSKIASKEESNCAHSDDDVTPLIKATDNDDIEKVALLLADPAVNLNQPDKNGDTPLHYAAANGYEEIVAQLLARSGINLNKPNKDGNTPLHCAAANGHEEIVLQLLGRQGINPNQPNTDDLTPLELAACNNHKNIVSLLLKDDKIDYDYVYRRAIKKVVKQLIVEQLIDRQLIDRQPIDKKLLIGKQIIETLQELSLICPDDQEPITFIDKKFIDEQITGIQQELKLISPSDQDKINSIDRQPINEKLIDILPELNLIFPDDQESITFINKQLITILQKSNLVSPDDQCEIHPPYNIPKCSDFKESKEKHKDFVIFFTKKSRHSTRFKIIMSALAMFTAVAPLTILAMFSFPKIILESDSKTATLFSVIGLAIGICISLAAYWKIATEERLRLFKVKIDREPPNKGLVSEPKCPASDTETNNNQPTRAHQVKKIAPNLAQFGVTSKIGQEQKVQLPKTQVCSQENNIDGEFGAGAI